MSLTRHDADDPESCEEFGYGLGDPGGILVLRYRSADALAFGESRQDFLHQLYWSPDGPLATTHGSSVRFVADGEAFWARRATSHDVRAGDRQTVYRICLREVPPALGDLRSGPVPIDAEAMRLVEAIARRGCDEKAALDARRRIMAGIGAPAAGAEAGTRTGTGNGFALAVARALSHDPADPTGLDEWARRLRVSVKTLQRDFEREFGMPYTRWRTALRLRAARALLDFRPVSTVAHQVGYASTSAFISAFAKEYGYTPGRHRAPAPASAPGRLRTG